MRILRAVARAAMALAMVIAVWCKELGRFLLRCLPGYQPPDPAMLLDQYEDAAEVAPVAPEPDQRLQNIQEIAEGLFRHQTPDPALADGLSSHTMEWLATLDADMLLKVSKSKLDDLQAHIKGQRSIRGVLAFDPESVKAYRAAVAQESEAEPELEYYRRRPRREPLLPAFGPIC